ncbi:MAG: polysaccharide deacetylase family protein [Alphaproteobacteria bacterium]|nr:polysaccharide deacetylase family protein [Alphaproteobacteria bacterium]
MAAPHGRSPQPDIANFSWVEYGLRCGVPRLVEALRDRGLPASNIMSASLPEIYPSVAQAALDAGWALTGHNVVQRSLQDEEDEVAAIRETLERLEAFAGERPRGWLGPGFAETMETPDHLAAAGIEYVHEWMVDDLPCWMQTQSGPMIAMPYALDLNDVTVFVIEKHEAKEYVRRFEATLRIFEAELARQPRVLTLALHPHVIGVPYRLGALLEVIDMLQARSDTVFMSGPEIADWYRSVESPC